MIVIITWVQYYKLKPLQPLFSNCQNNRFTVHAYLSNKHNHSCSNLPHQYWGNFEEKAILLLEKTYFNFSARKVTTSDMIKLNRCFCIFQDMLGRNNFRLNKAWSLNINFFSFENCPLGKKYDQRLWRHFKNLVGNLKYKHLVTRGCYYRHYLFNLVSFHGKGMTVPCHLPV